MDEFDFEELKNRLNEISATLHHIKFWTNNGD